MREMSDAEACAAAARAWPELPVPDARFLEHLHEQIVDATELAELHVADLSLAHHAIRGEPGAVAALRHARGAAPSAAPHGSRRAADRGGARRSAGHADRATSRPNPC